MSTRLQHRLLFPARMLPPPHRHPPIVVVSGLEVMSHKPNCLSSSTSLTQVMPNPTRVGGRVFLHRACHDRPPPWQTGRLAGFGLSHWLSASAHRLFHPFPIPLRLSRHLFPSLIFFFLATAPTLGRVGLEFTAIGAASRWVVPTLLINTLGFCFFSP